MRIGLIGLGRIESFHADTLADLSQVSELVVTDPVAAATDAVTARVTKARAVESPQALLDSGVDGAVIAAATNTHFALLLAAVKAGVPTFCEKPIARTADEAVQVRDLVAGSDVAVQIGYPRRFDPAFVAARDAVRAGTLGRVHTIRSTTMDPAPPPTAYLAISDGIFRDCSVHDYDAVRWVIGREVVDVYAVGAVDPTAPDQMYAANGDWTTVSTLLTMDDGTSVSSPTRVPTREGTTSASRSTAPRTRSPPASTTVCRCAPRSRVSRGPAAPRTRSSWTGSPTPSAASSPPSARSRQVPSLRRAPSRTPWGRRGSPRPRRCPPARGAVSRSTK